MAKKRFSEQRAREVTRELLAFRDWNLHSVSSSGQVLEENEYKNYPTLSVICEGKSKKLNEILRECKIKDEYRPIYVATFMLALWKGDVSVGKEVVLTQINANAEQALNRAGKPGDVAAMLA